MLLESFARAPFNLDRAAIEWVEKTFARLSPDERLAQLFVLRSGLDRPGFERLIQFKPGGLTAVFGPDPDAEIRNIDELVAASSVPPTISADLEGSRMSIGTPVLNPLGLAAVNDLDATAEVSRIMAEEGAAAGINWSFTPVLDIAHAFRSAIVGTRGFGSDVSAIERHAVKQIEVFQKHGIAATAKHWPGEGFDDRDQHLVTTVNPLSLAEWEATFGRLYRSAINSGVMSVMSAHIAFPAFVRSLDPEAGIEAFRPASLSRLLNIELLRKRLGFNGLIMSDATGMAGFGAWSAREKAIPEILSAGCDVILFSHDPEADVAAIKAALRGGSLDQERVDEAMLRVLAFKAALGLHRPKVPHDRSLTRGSAANRQAAEKITARAPTLVKDTQSLSPLDLKKHRRVLIVTPGVVMPFLKEPLPFVLPKMLEEEGFAVARYEPGAPIVPAEHDVVLYLFGDETLLTRSRIYVDWLKLSGGDVIKAMERTWHQIPTAMISFGYPYLLYDAPRVPTYVNAYSTLESVQRAVLECLVGRAEWNRHNPVDPFCGLEDARY
jgi:beta-N-acetylhexosaminidase